MTLFDMHNSLDHILLKPAFPLWFWKNILLGRLETGAVTGWTSPKSCLDPPTQAVVVACHWVLRIITSTMLKSCRIWPASQLLATLTSTPVVFTTERVRPSEPPLTSLHFLRNKVNILPSFFLRTLASFQNRVEVFWWSLSWGCDCRVVGELGGLDYYKHSQLN